MTDEPPRSHPNPTPARALLDLPAAAGERFQEEWPAVRRRIAVVHGVPVPRETEPAGAPRLAVPDDRTV